MTQVGEERPPARQAEPPHAPVPVGPGLRVRVEAGTLMQKLLPRHLVDPYLSSQRSVITGFVHRAQDGDLPDPAWLRQVQSLDNPAAGPGQDTAETWVLRWRALEIQTYLASAPAAFGGGLGWVSRAAYGTSGHPAFELFIEPGPIPVGTEMYRITAAGEEFIARHDGQAWLRPGPGPEG